MLCYRFSWQWVCTMITPSALPEASSSDAEVVVDRCCPRNTANCFSMAFRRRQGHLFNPCCRQIFFSTVQQISAWRVQRNGKDRCTDRVPCRNQGMMEHIPNCLDATSIVL